MKIGLKTIVPVLGLFALLATGCGSDNTNNQTSSGSPPSVVQTSATTTVVTRPAPVLAQGTTLVQEERLARPAINEGLLITNAFLNAFNEIPPSQDVAALGGPVGAEAVATLTALGNSASQIGFIVAALIPDEMRIDTTIVSGYAGGVTFTGAAFTSNINSIPSGGRLLLDDVVDITLKLLLHNAAATDNVNYTANPGNAATGHQPLSTVFPYLAPPN